MLHFLKFLFTEIKLSLDSVEGGNWLNILSSVAQLCSDHFTGSGVWASLGWFLFHFGLFCKVWEWKQSHKPKKSHNWVGFLPLNYITTLPKVSFRRHFNSQIRKGKKFICRGVQSHYLLFTDVKLSTERWSCLFQVIQQSSGRQKNRSESFSAFSVASLCLPVLMKTSKMSFS